LRVDEVSKKRERTGGENALGRVNGDAELLKSAEDSANMLDVLLSVRRRNEDVVDVGENEIETGENRVD